MFRAEQTTLHCCYILAFNFVKDIEMVNVIVRSICVILIGVLMVVMREAFMPVIIQFIGVAFIVSGAISIFNVYLLHKKGLSKSFDSVVLATAGIAAIALGAWLLLAPGFFLSLLMLVLGVLLLAMGLYQLIMLLVAHRRVGLSMYAYIVPVILLALGVLVIVNPFEAAGVPFFIVGAGAVLGGVSDLVAALYVMHRSKRLK